MLSDLRNFVAICRCCEVIVILFVSNTADAGNKGLILKDGQYTKYPYQIVCSRRKAILIVTLLVCAIFALALIAALARPGCSSSQNLDQNNLPLTTSTPKTSTEAFSTDGRPFPWKEIRLPESFLPQMYHIFMHPDLMNFTFSGSIHMELKVLTATDFVVFHSKELDIHSVSLTLTGWLTNETE